MTGLLLWVLPGPADSCMGQDRWCLESGVFFKGLIGVDSANMFIDSESEQLGAARICFRMTWEKSFPKARLCKLYCREVNVQL